MTIKYPIYIISKGRWESRLTIKALEEMNIPFFVVVEPQEYEKYSRVVNASKILTLPFSNLGQGSIPARNWVWQDSIERGFARHWIIDDNINGFIRLNRNRKIKVDYDATFRAVEDFCDRYENVYMSGMNYRYFAPELTTKAPYLLNTRIYSCILLSNKCEIRWRGKYNEDTDLSLRILKAGYCTILFNAFLCNKVGTLKMKGGNTDEIYGDSHKRLEFAQSLKEQHPDIVKIVQRYDRWHHEVNYDAFKKNKLIKKNDLIISDRVNNYGMKLIQISK